MASDASLWSSDFAASALPFRYEAPVWRIYDALGLKALTPGSTLLGEALREIREHVEHLPPKEKQKALDTTLRILKPNSGVFADGNDFVTAHTLEQIFYKDLFKDDYNTTGADMVPGLEKKLAYEKSHGFSSYDIAQTQRQLDAAKSGNITPQPSFNQIVDNFGTLMDMVGAGGLLKSTIKFGSKWMPKSLTKLRKVAPDMATRTAVDALDDEAIRLKFPGMSKQDIIASSLPSASKALQEGGFEGFGELIARQLDIKDRMLRISERSNMSAAERATAFDEIQQQFGDIAAKPKSHLHLNESVFTRGDASATIEAIFGRTKSKPYTTYEGALKASAAEIEQTFGKDAAVQVVWRDPKTKLLVEVPAGTKPKKAGEFFLRVKDERAYEAAPTTYHSLVMGDKEVANLQFASSLWKHLRGVTNLLSKDTADSIRLTSRQRTEWNKLTAGLLADVSTLSASQGRKLAKVLKDGEAFSAINGKGRTYAPSELRNLGLNESGVRAYYSYRTGVDIMYEVANRDLRTRMLRDGMVDVHTKKGRVGFAQPRTLTDAVKDIPLRANGLHVYDPITNEFKVIDRVDLEGIYKGGRTMARMEQAMMGKGGAEASHILVDAKGGTKMLGLPRQVLTKVEGYYPHMWNGNYVVYGLTRAGNRFALGLASNESDAKAVAQRMNGTIARRAASRKGNRFSEVSYDFDRSLSQDMARRGGVQEGMYVNMGGPVYGHRNGGSLRNYSKAAGDIQVDPIEAMLRGMEIVGSKVTKGDLATYMRQKLYKYAKDEGVLKDPRIIPHTVDDLMFSAGKSLQYNKAKGYLDGIDNMLNMRDAVDEAVSSFFQGAAGVASRMGMKAISGKLASKAAAGGDPMSALMGLMHRTTIASSPIGQGALQASQSLMMLGVSPLNYVKAVEQTSVVGLMIGMRTAALHGSKGGFSHAQFLKEAKLVGMAAGLDGDELVKLVDTILDTGLVSAVGYHTQMRNAIRSAAEERMLAKAKGLNRVGAGVVGRFARAADAATFGNLSRYGFEAGESFNQIATFMTLYNRDKGKGIANLADPDYVKKLVGSTAELTGDMLPETGLTYQRGWFKAAMQFVSFQHKMMLLTLPKALGGAQSLTGMEKAGMIFAQFLLFGRRGAPHMDAIYRVVDARIRDQAGEEGVENEMYAQWNHPTTRAVMDGLVFDTAGNYVMKRLLDQDVSYALSERFAPGGGSEFMVDRLFHLASNPTQGIFGLAGEKTSKIYSFLKRSGGVMLANVREHDDEDLGVRFEEMAREGLAHSLSIYNRYLAVKAAERMDGFVSAGGAVTEGFSGPLEGVLYTQFGITTKDRESLYQTMDKYLDEQLSNPLAREKDREQLARDYYTDLINSTVKFNNEATSDDVYEQLEAKWVRERGLLFSLLPPEDAEYIRDHVAERLRRAAVGEGDSAETILVDRLTTKIRSGVFGEDGPAVAAYLDEAEFVRNNPKLKQMVIDAWNEANTDDYMERK